MKTVLLCAGLMAAAIILAVWSTREVDKLCNQAKELIQQAEIAAEEEDFPRAEEKLSAAGELLGEKKTFLTSFHNDEQVTEILTAIRTAERCAKNADRPGLNENTALAMELLSALTRTDRPTIGNILQSPPGSKGIICPGSAPSSRRPA